MTRFDEIEKDSTILTVAFWVVIIFTLGVVAFNIVRYLIERG